MTTVPGYNDDAAMISRMQQHRLKGLADMAGGMAHEINQPLGGIRGFAEGILIGLEEGWDISQAEIKAKMRRIIAEADRIDDLIQSVRGFADERARLDMVTVEVMTAVRAAVRLMGTRLQAAGIDLEISAQGGRARVRANPFGIQEVVQILLSNAGDACIARAGTGRGRISIVVDGGVLPSDPVSVRVSDNGIGMDAPTLAKAGEPFFTTKVPDRGVGLGLATARGVLTQCSGQLDIASQPGTGTTVTVRLHHRIAEQEST